MENLLFYLLAIGILGILFSIWKSLFLKTPDNVDENTKRLSTLISDGANLLLKTESYVMWSFVAVVAILLALNTIGQDLKLALVIPFLVGAGSAWLVSKVSVETARKTNIRAAFEAQSSVNDASKTLFNGANTSILNAILVGTVTLSVLYLIFMLGFEESWGAITIINVLAPYALGASLVNIFTKIKGTIFTNATELGAEIAEKSEDQIPVQIPYNVSIFTRLSGRNIGELAGTTVDLFETTFTAVIGAMIIGAIFASSEAFKNVISEGAVILPLGIVGWGLVVSEISAFFIKSREGSGFMKSSKVALFIALPTMILGSYYIVKSTLPMRWELELRTVHETITYSYAYLGVFWSIVTGMIAGAGYSFVNEYLTAKNSIFTKGVNNDSKHGAVSNLLSGFENGMNSTLLAVVVIAIMVIETYHFAGIYGIAMAAVGMLSISVIYSSIYYYSLLAENVKSFSNYNASNAQTKQNIDTLNDLGNAKANLKSFAVITSVMTVMALFGAFFQQAGIYERGLDIARPLILAGLLIGAMLPYLFAGQIAGSILKTANVAADEIRRQFNDIPLLKSALGILRKYNYNFSQITDNEQKMLIDATAAIDSNNFVSRVAKTSVNQIILPLILVIVLISVAGIWGGIDLLSSMLAGAFVSAILLAVFQTDSGQFWSNVKRMFETNAASDKPEFSINSETYKATATSETLGNAFKDTIAPALLILLKFMIIMAIMIAVRIKEN